MHRSHQVAIVFTVDAMAVRIVALLVEHFTTVVSRSETGNLFDALLLHIVFHDRVVVLILHGHLLLLGRVVGLNIGVLDHRRVEVTVLAADAVLVNHGELTLKCV